LARIAVSLGLMRLVLGLALASALACSAGAEGTATVEGSVQGTTLFAQDAIFAGFLLEDGTRQDAVQITSYAKACDQSRDNAGVPNGVTLTLFLSQTDAAGGFQPVSAGTFRVAAEAGAERSAVAIFQKYDESCAGTLEAVEGTATGGTVEVTRAGSSFLDGSFELALPGGDHLSGEFHAAICAEPTRKPGATCKAE
jgi:hypothetical protein